MPSTSGKVRSTLEAANLWHGHWTWLKNDVTLPVYHSGKIDYKKSWIHVVMWMVHSHLSEGPLVWGSTWNLTLNLTLAVTLSLCLYFSDKWTFGQLGGHHPDHLQNLIRCCLSSSHPSKIIHKNLLTFELLLSTDKRTKAET